MLLLVVLSYPCATLLVFYARVTRDTVCSDTEQIIITMLDTKSAVNMMPDSAVYMMSLSSAPS
jgi:hypothetical protein